MDFHEAVQKVIPFQSAERPSLQLQETRLVGLRIEYDGLKLVYQLWPDLNHWAYSEIEPEVRLKPLRNTTDILEKDCAILIPQYLALGVNFL
jgi:hypothetical protein